MGCFIMVSACGCSTQDGTIMYTTAIFSINIDCLTSWENWNNMPRDKFNYGTLDNLQDVFGEGQK